MAEPIKPIEPQALVQFGLQRDIRGLELLAALREEGAVDGPEFDRIPEGERGESAIWRLLN